jgi:hypothetical protein
MMWKKYKRRVLLAMSSQMFAQLVRHRACLHCDLILNPFGFLEWYQRCVEPSIFIDLR